MNVPRGQVLVLYGIAGDLAKKMIIPALYRLAARGVLNMPVIGVDRGNLDIATLRRHVHDSVTTAFGRVDEDVFGALADRLVPVTGDVTEAAVYTELARHIADEAFAVHYLAVPPALFAPITEGLGAAGLNTRGRLVVVKPFGHDLASLVERDRIHLGVDRVDPHPQVRATQGRIMLDPSQQTSLPRIVGEHPASQFGGLLQHPHHPRVAPLPQKQPGELGVDIRSGRTGDPPIALGSLLGGIVCLARQAQVGKAQTLTMQQGSEMDIAKDRISDVLEQRSHPL
jgi:hypothetical protein